MSDFVIEVAEELEKKFVTVDDILFEEWLDFVVGYMNLDLWLDFIGKE